MMDVGRRVDEEVEGYKMPKIKLLSQEGNEAVFHISDVTPGYVNAIRRSIIADVPTLAIEDVEVRKNNSVLYDEIAAHRLGLIPLTTDLSSYNRRDTCKCEGEGCARCSVKLTIKELGPKTVLASDIKSSDPKVKPVYPDIPIVILLPDQEFELEATAVLGTGKEHAKWTPAHVYYKIMPSFKIDQSLVEDPKALAEKNEVFEVKNGKLAINENKFFVGTDFAAFSDMTNGAVQIEDKEGEYVFYLESWGQLSPGEIMAKAVEVFDLKLEEFEASL